MKNVLMSLFAASILTTGVMADNSENYYNVVVNSQQSTGFLNQIASTIADQLGQNKDFPDLKNTPIGVTSIVNLENFSEITKTTNVVTENLIHEMQIRGYKVIDFKAMPTIKIGSNGGDYVFSRDLGDLRTKQNISYALSGTYSYQKGGLVLNCRIVNLENNVVLASAQAFIPKNVIRDVERDSIVYRSNFAEKTDFPYTVDIQRR